MHFANGKSVDEIAKHLHRWGPFTPIEHLRKYVESIVGTKAAGGKFDENKHKRDDAGKFSEKEGTKDLDEAENRYDPDTEPPYAQTFLKMKREHDFDHKKHHLKDGPIKDTWGNSVSKEQVAEANGVLMWMLDTAKRQGLVQEGYEEFPNIYSGEPQAIRTILNNKPTIEKLLEWSRSDDPKLWKWIPPLAMRWDDAPAPATDSNNISVERDIYTGQFGITIMSPAEYLSFTLGTGDLDKMRAEKRYGEESDKTIASLIKAMKEGKPMNTPSLVIDENNEVIQQDGNHRSLAAYKAGIEKVPVYIYKHGPLSDKENKKLQNRSHGWMTGMNPDSHFAAGAGNRFGPVGAMLRLEMTLAAAGRKFDEHKHKRDEGGKFSKKGEAGRRITDLSPTAPKDTGGVPEKYKRDFKVQDYSKTYQNYGRFIKQTKMKAFSFDPVNGVGYDATDRSDAIELHRKFSNGKDQLFFIGITNNLIGENKKGDLERLLESEYSRIQGDNLKPFIGKWTDPKDGSVYLDISFPVDHGIPEEKIQELLKHYNQEAPLRINKGGHVDFE